jgi:hypothetical protein
MLIIYFSAVSKQKDAREDVFLQNPAPCYFPANAVSSPLVSLTSVFEMGTGVASPLKAPGCRQTHRRGHICWMLASQKMPSRSYIQLY